MTKRRRTETWRNRARNELVAAIAARQNGEEEPPITLTTEAWQYIREMCIEFGAQYLRSGPNPSPGLNTGDYRRIASIACAAATGDDFAIQLVTREAAELGRTNHLLTAAGMSIANGFNAHTPEGLTELRQNVARLAALENEEEN